MEASDIVSAAVKLKSFVIAPPAIEDVSIQKSSVVIKSEKSDLKFDFDGCSTTNINDLHILPAIAETIHLGFNASLWMHCGDDRTDELNSLRGILNHLNALLANDIQKPGGASVSVGSDIYVTVYEIVQNNVNDLLSSTTKPKVRTNSKTGEIFVAGLERIKCTDADCVLNKVGDALSQRCHMVAMEAVGQHGAKQLGEYKSELVGAITHCFVTLELCQYTFNAKDKQFRTKNSTLRLLSFATPETLSYRPEKSTYTRIMSLKEYNEKSKGMKPREQDMDKGSTHIAALQFGIQSLTTLTRVIKALCTDKSKRMGNILSGPSRTSSHSSDGAISVSNDNSQKNPNSPPPKRLHVPFRDSLLTRLLQFSLLGNYSIFMVTTITSASDVNFLRFASEIGGLFNMMWVNEHVLTNSERQGLFEDPSHRSNLQVALKSVKSTVFRMSRRRLSQEVSLDAITKSFPEDAKIDDEIDKVSETSNTPTCMEKFQAVLGMLADDFHELQTSLENLETEQGILEETVLEQLGISIVQKGPTGFLTTVNESQEDAAGTKVLDSFEKHVYKDSYQSKRGTKMLVRSAPIEARELVGQHTEWLEDTSDDNLSSFGDSPNGSLRNISHKSIYSERSVTPNRMAQALESVSKGSEGAEQDASKSTLAGMGILAVEMKDSVKDGSNQSDGQNVWVSPMDNVDVSKLQATNQKQSDSQAPRRRPSTSADADTDVKGANGGTGTTTPNARPSTSGLLRRLSANLSPSRATSAVSKYLPDISGIGGRRPSAATSAASNIKAAGGSMKQGPSASSRNSRPSLSQPVSRPSSRPSSRPASSTGKRSSNAGDRIPSSRISGSNRISANTPRGPNAKGPPPTSLSMSASVPNHPTIDVSAALLETSEQPSHGTLTPISSAATPSSMLSDAQRNSFEKRRPSFKGENEKAAGGDPGAQSESVPTLERRNSKSLSRRNSKGSMSRQGSSNNVFESFSEQTQDAMEAAAERLARKRKTSFKEVSLDKSRHGSYADPVRELTFEEIQYFDAVKEGNLEKVEYALSIGMNPCLKNDYNRDGMQLAARNGSLPLLRCMQSYGASVHTVGFKGDTLFHMAAMNGHVQVLKWLHSEGVNPETVDHAGQTAVHIAARRGELDVLKYLNTIQMDFKKKDGNGLTPLQCVPRSDYEDCKKYIQRVLVQERDAAPERRRSKSASSLQPLVQTLNAEASSEAKSTLEAISVDELQPGAEEAEMTPSTSSEKPGQSPVQQQDEAASAEAKEALVESD